MFCFLFVVFFIHNVNSYDMMKDSLNVSYKTDYFPVFQKPKIIGFYSVDGNRQLDPSASNLKYFYSDEGKIRYDLNSGFDDYIPKPSTTENVEKIDTLLLWLNRQNLLKKMINEDSKNGGLTFVCARGLLTTIMKTPYEYSESWFICATKVKNVIFLCAFYTNQKKRKLQQPLTEREKRFEYWGFKFEQFLLTEKPEEKPNTTKAVNSNEEFILVFRSKLNEHNLIYGAEVDGVNSKHYIHDNLNCDLLNTLKFTELKTSRHIEFERQEENFKRHKLLKWWCQSFLVGIENVTCGFRDDKGIVEELQTFNVKDLPKISAGLWNATSCMRFLDDFLNYVKETFSNEPDLTTWRFDWLARSTYVTRQRLSENSPYVILPDWFSI